MLDKIMITYWGWFNDFKIIAVFSFTVPRYHLMIVNNRINIWKFYTQI